MIETATTRAGDGVLVQLTHGEFEPEEVTFVYSEGDEVAVALRGELHVFKGEDARRLAFWCQEQNGRLGTKYGVPPAHLLGANAF